MKIKKHLSFTALRKMISNSFRSWGDPRREKSTDHSVHDAAMSGLACMFFDVHGCTNAVGAGRAGTVKSLRSFSSKLTLKNPYRRKTISINFLI